jgi:hypothetical protein
MKINEFFTIFHQILIKIRELKYYCISLDSYWCQQLEKYHFESQKFRERCFPEPRVSTETWISKKKFKFFHYYSPSSQKNSRARMLCTVELVLMPAIRKISLQSSFIATNIIFNALNVDRGMKIDEKSTTFHQNPSKISKNSRA